MMIQWLVVLNNGRIIHFKGVLNNGRIIHCKVVLNNGRIIHWLVVLNNGRIIHWQVVLNRCRDNRGMCNKRLVKRHMMRITRSLLSGITISRKGNNIRRSHMATYKNFPHAGNKSDFLTSHCVRPKVRISTPNASKQYCKEISYHIETAMRWLPLTRTS